MSSSSPASTLQQKQSSSGPPHRSNQYDRTVLNNAQMNTLVDRVFARVLDLAQARRIHFNAARSQYELETLDVATIRHAHVLNKPSLDRFLPPTDAAAAADDDKNDIKFTVLNHTCPVCLVSFECAQFLVRHFTNAHVLAKPTYKCSVCTGEIKYMSIDDYFRHCFSDEEHLTWFFVKQFKSFYSLFLIKFIQDMIVNHYINGAYCVVKLRSNNKTTSSLVERMSIKMNEMFFSRPTSSSSPSSLTTTQAITSSSSSTSCKPAICLSAKSIRSNQACANQRVAQTDLVGEILKYALVEASSSAAVFLRKAVPDSVTYMQCSWCFTLLDDRVDELKMHIIETHVYNETLNKCLVCCYCRQVLKSNNDQVNVVDLFNQHVMSNECLGVRQGAMPLISVDWFDEQQQQQTNNRQAASNTVGDANHVSRKRKQHSDDDIDDDGQKTSTNRRRQEVDKANGQVRTSSSLDQQNHDENDKNGDDQCASESEENEIANGNGNGYIDYDDDDDEEEEEEMARGLEIGGEDDEGHFEDCEL